MEGSKMLVALKHQNILLSIQAVEHTLCMAEQHLPSTKSGANAGAKKVLKTGTDTQDANESAPSEQPVFTQAELKKIKALLTQSPGNDKQKGKPSGSGGKGKGKGKLQSEGD
eukprot:2022973-Rhodomonas_salina.3